MYIYIKYIYKYKYLNMSLCKVYFILFVVILLMKVFIRFYIQYEIRDCSRQWTIGPPYQIDAA
jgi:hypothetical protein